MPFLSAILIKFSLILFAASHIAIAGPVPDVGNGHAVGGREQASGGSVSGSNQTADGDSLLSGVDLLELLSGNGGHGGEVEGAEPKKPASHNKGVGGSSLAGTRHRQGSTVSQPTGPFGAGGESAQGGSADGGSVIGSGGGILNILSGNGGAGGGESSGLDIVDILRKRSL